MSITVFCRGPKNHRDNGRIVVSGDLEVTFPYRGIPVRTDDDQLTYRDLIIFDDGTTLVVTFDDDGIWRIDQHTAGRARFTRDRLPYEPSEEFLLYDQCETEVAVLVGGGICSVRQAVYADPRQYLGTLRPCWLEPHDDPTDLGIDWDDRQAAAAIPFKVVDGRPVNPHAPTGIEFGRGGLGRWGENLCVDAVVVAQWQGQRWLLMVERGDGHGWALPGGGVDAGETPAAAVVRELAEETALAVPPGLWRPSSATYVPDPRASDEAWAVTVPHTADLGQVEQLPAVAGGDDAAHAAWLRADSYPVLLGDLRGRFAGRVFAAHVDLLQATLTGRTGGAR